MPNFSADGTITQIFSTGDFSIWCPQRGQMFMCFVNVADLSFEEAPQKGDDVTFHVRDGQVYAVALHDHDAMTPLRAAM